MKRSSITRNIGQKKTGGETEKEQIEMSPKTGRGEGKGSRRDYI